MSVRSIIGGDLTLNNLDVTTINDVAYPPASAAGTIIQIGNSQFSIVSGLAGNQISTFTLPAGVWTINISVGFFWNTFTQITSQAISLQSAPTFGAGESVFFGALDELFYTIGTNASNGFSKVWSYTTTLTTPQPFYLMYQTTFTGSGSITSSTAGSPLGYSMKAVQIA